MIRIQSPNFSYKRLSKKILPRQIDRFCEKPPPCPNVPTVLCLSMGEEVEMLCSDVWHVSPGRGGPCRHGPPPPPIYTSRFPNHRETVYYAILRQDKNRVGGTTWQPDDL